MANNLDSDQILHSAASDMGLFNQACISQYFW